MGKYAEWFAAEEARESESKVIVLPVRDRVLLNGWTSAEMRLYCRLRVEDAVRTHRCHKK